MAAKKQDQPPAPHEPRWDDIRVFLAIQRCGSLGQAAFRLGLDTSTVSRRLAALEESLGERLFERSRDGLAATRAAGAVLSAAEAMEAAHARLTREASDLESSVQGVVRLSMPPGLADTFIAPALPRLRALHPKLCIELDASARVLDIARHEADLALRSIRPENAQLLTVKLLGAQRWAVATSQTYARELGRVDDWNALPWITWDRDLATFGPSRWLARHAPKAEIVLRTSHFASQLAAARAGLGVVLVLEIDRRVRDLAAVQFTRSLHKSVSELPTDDLWMVGHQNLHDVPRVEAVWRFLRDEIKEQTRDLPTS
jgi:DNA-binding transcriptional LysR family regulator